MKRTALPSPQILTYGRLSTLVIQLSSKTFYLSSFKTSAWVRLGERALHLCLEEEYSVKPLIPAKDQAEYVAYSVPVCTNIYRVGSMYRLVYSQIDFHNWLKGAGQPFSPTSYEAGIVLFSISCRMANS